MILSGLEINKRLGKDIHITPFNSDRLNPNSYDLTLHDTLLVYQDRLLDVKRDNPTAPMKIAQTGSFLMPGELYLGRTVEHTKTTNLVPMVEGKSSIGRLGLFIHITAGFGDVGFNGYWTLEISCIKPVKIYPAIPICQIYYHTLLGDYEFYHGKYQNNKGIQGSMMYREFK